MSKTTEEQLADLVKTHEAMGTLIETFREAIAEEEGEPKYSVGDWVLSKNGAWYVITAIVDGEPCGANVSNSGGGGSGLITGNIAEHFPVCGMDGDLVVNTGKSGPYVALYDYDRTIKSRKLVAPKKFLEQLAKLRGEE